MSGYNHFEYVPSSVTSDRSGFVFKKTVPQGAQLGWLYPMCAPIRMIPGSSLTLDLSIEIRSGALIAPLMTELYLDCFAFNVPNRIVWEHWKQFLGAVDDVLFDNLSTYTIPSFKYGGCAVQQNAAAAAWVDNSHINYQWNQTLACHFELPFPYKGSEGDYKSYEFVEISALPFRGYNFIWNEFFTPEYLSDRVLFSKTDDGKSGDNMTYEADSNYWERWSGVATPVPSPFVTGQTVSVGGCVLPVSRAHRSLWTSCLPKPSLETINLLDGVQGHIPVYLENASGAIASDATITPFAFGAIASGGSGPLAGQTSGGAQSGFLRSNLDDAVLTVNAYRELVLLQNYFNVLNSAGSRYDEILVNLFHTRSPQAVISIPELIVHKRFTIYRKEVVATAQTNNGSSNVKPLGSQGAYIDTIVNDNFFTKSVTEHSYIHLLYCIRPAYIVMTSGFEPMWTQLTKFDQFYPQFQGMGDVPRGKMEVSYAFTSADSKTAVLGYQEYSAEYKYQRNSAVGWLDPHTPNPIRGYTINDEFYGTANVSLSNYYLSCATEEVSFSNCLAITSPLLAPQFILDIRLNGKIYEPMKVYNIPGQGDLL